MQPDRVTAPVVPWVALALVVSLALHGYLWLRLVRDPARARWLGLLLGALGLVMPAGMLGLLYMRGLPRRYAQPLMTSSFSYLGLLFFVVLSLLALDLLSFWPRLGRALRPRRKAGLALGVSVLLSAGAVAQALRPPAVHEQQVRLAALPAELERYRIVQLSDVHIGPTLGRAFVQALVEATNAQQPDLVVITGDLVDGSPDELGPLLGPLRTLRARDGVYLVLGNHEYLSGAEAWSAFLPSLGIRLLRNECVRVRESLDLVGLDDDSTTQEGKSPADFALAFNGHVASRLAIALVHEPAAIAEVSRRGAALQLSGHTHGGQIFPLHLFAWLDQRYLAGLYQVGPTALHVSPGAGFWGPPMRLGSRAEISLLVLSR